MGVLTAKFLYLIAGGFTEHVTFKAMLAGFDKVFVPFVIGAVGDAILTTNFGNAALATDTLHDDENLLFRGEYTLGVTADIIQ